MTPDPLLASRALLKSLIQAPLLVGNLPEAGTFPYQNLLLPAKVPPLNFEQKLGHLYEDVLARLLQFSPHYDLLAQNVQIQKDIHTTLGELDFLIRDLASGQLIHLELATKFYLALDTPAGLALPGPDARDNYFKKIARLREHQLQLPARYHEHLPEPYRNEAIITQQLIDGCLFDHIDSPEPAKPEFLNPNCRRGKWLHQHEILNHFEESDQFQVIPKSLWPVPLCLLRPLVFECWSHNQQLDRCVMVRYQDDPAPYFLAPDSYARPLEACST